MDIEKALENIKRQISNLGPEVAEKVINDFKELYKKELENNVSGVCD